MRGDDDRRVRGDDDDLCAGMTTGACAGMTAEKEWLLTGETPVPLQDARPTARRPSHCEMHIPPGSSVHRADRRNTIGCMSLAETPISIDLKKDKGLTIAWADGSSSYYSVAWLRRMSPSADMKQLRSEMEKNPLTVLNTRSGARSSGELRVLDAELVGNYAIKFAFSDGHASGIYSWTYLRQIDPAAQRTHPHEDDGAAAR